MPVTSTLDRLPILTLAGLAVAWLGETRELRTRSLGGALWTVTALTGEGLEAELVILPLGEGRSSQYHPAIREQARMWAEQSERPFERLWVIDLRSTRAKADGLVPRELKHLPLEVWRTPELTEALHQEPFGARLRAWRGDRQAITGLPEPTLLTRFLVDELKADQFTHLSAAGGDTQRRTRLARVFVDLRIDPASGAPGQPPRKLAATALSRAALPRVEGDSGGLMMRLAEGGNAGLRRRLLLLGGPGQGKTTLGVYLCQIHRAAWLDAYASKLNDESKAILGELRANGAISGVVGRRLPIRVVLHKYADALARGDVQDLWGYLEAYARKRIGGDDITAHLLRSWLVAWPSLVVLDGLDEVPATANRAPMLATLERFLSELERAGADLYVVATTRPQGYRGELSHESWEQHSIQDFDPKEAEDYGRLLLNEWVRTDGVRRDELGQRVRRAVNEGATAHLARSPLQVMILTILVEQTGSPPRDRWRLFKEYFRIILDRERERGIPAVQILREHQELVERLHAEVGYRLHLAAEREAGTSSGMDEGVFEAVIRQMFAEYGHRGDGLEALVRRVREAALDRLVFLVGDGNGHVGFEIRSLQEFQAAERLFWGDEGLLPRRLDAIALSAHWRNVLLFAAGRIAVERPHLLDRVVGLCDSLDSAQGGWGARLRLGAQLAVGLLGESALNGRPNVREALLSRVIDGFGEQDGAFAYEIAQNLGGEAKGELLALLRRHLRPECRVAWAVAGSWVSEGDADALDVVIERLPGGGETGWNHLRWWFDEWPTEFLSVLVVRLWEVIPLKVWIWFRWRPQELAPEAQALFAPFAWGYLRPAELVAPRLPLRFWRNAGPTDPLPKGVLSNPQEHAAMSAVLEFNRDSTPDRLAEALAVLRSQGDTEQIEALASVAAWPLRACLLKGGRDLLELEQDARRGILGSAADWRAFDQRMGRYVISMADLAGLHSAGQPLSAALSVRGLPRGGGMEFNGAVDLDALARALPHSALKDQRAVTFGNCDESISKLSDSSHVWDLPLFFAAYEIRSAAYERALSAPHEAVWFSRLVKWCRTAIATQSALDFPYIDEQVLPLSDDSVRVLTESLSAHPELVLLLANLVERGQLQAQFVAAVAGPIDTSARIQAEFALLEVANVASDTASLLAERLIVAASDLPGAWSRVASMCRNQRPSGAIPLLTRLIERVNDDPELHLANALRDLLIDRPAAVHDPARAAELQLPAPPPGLINQPAPVALVPATPLHLQSIQLQQLRTWERLDLTLAPPQEPSQWIFFVGENGTGKTTLLRALALALVGAGTGAALLARTPGTMVRSGAGRGAVNLRLSDGRVGQAVLTDAGLDPAGGALDMLVVGYGPRRGTLLGVTRQELNFNPIEAVETLFIEGGNLVHAESWLLSLHHRSLEPGAVAALQVLDAVKSLLKKVLPGVDRIDISADAVRVSGPNVGDVPLRAVSDGYLTTAGWIIDLLARWMERERAQGRTPGPDFNERMTGLVLIDEVDLHLHPRWQREMVDDVRSLFPRLTFVVTTHNPVTLLGARPGEIFVLERDPTGRLSAVQRDIPPGTGVEAILTGAVFGLPSALDNDTVRLLDRHRELLRAAPESAERREVEVELRRRLGRFMDTSLEGLAQSVVAQELHESAEKLSVEDRQRAREKAREALRKMVQEGR